MASTNTLNRREFTLQSALALLSGVAITISGCEDSGSPGSPSSSPMPNSSSDVTGTVSANHGHSAVIAGAALTAGNALMLNIRGVADHPHTVELTGQDLTRIANRERLSKESSTDQSHRHIVTFN